jgi:ring-1,2-phenylacetyl-CoA epoxidase subunit PaaC
MTTSPTPLAALLLAIADDELILGHRDAEWTGHAPILEEDIAFSNIAQDEIGHSLVWYTAYEAITGLSPDRMAFDRPWTEFTCARFVTYPKGDFAYTVVRQFLFDVAEEVRLGSFAAGSSPVLKAPAEKILKEEAYHRLHTQGLLERLANATEESSRRMRAALAAAFPQALGLFEPLAGEELLVREGATVSSLELRRRWLDAVAPVLSRARLDAPLQAPADTGGRSGRHTEHLEPLIRDLQSVYRLVPGGQW